MRHFPTPGNDIVQNRTVARSERFELPTLGFEVRCSIQLSYERVRGLDYQTWPDRASALPPGHSPAQAIIKCPRQLNARFRRQIIGKIHFCEWVRSNAQPIISGSLARARLPCVELRCAAPRKAALRLCRERGIRR